jgi:hypothetical protein
MRTIRIYGSSDDLIEVGSDDGSILKEFNVYLDLDGDYADLLFYDDNKNKVAVVEGFYTNKGLWKFHPKLIGNDVTFSEDFQATDPDGFEYSDRVSLTGNIDSVLCKEIRGRSIRHVKG